MGSEGQSMGTVPTTLSVPPQLPPQFLAPQGQAEIRFNTLRIRQVRFRADWEKSWCFLIPQIIYSGFWLVKISVTWENFNLRWQKVRRKASPWEPRAPSSTDPRPPGHQGAVSSSADTLPRYRLSETVNTIENKQIIHLIPVPVHF